MPSPYDDGWLLDDLRDLRTNKPLKQIETETPTGLKVKLYNEAGHRVGPTILVRDVIPSRHGDA